MYISRETNDQNPLNSQCLKRLNLAITENEKLELPEVQNHA
jgi:hypothetical protein